MTIKKQIVRHCITSFKSLSISVLYLFFQTVPWKNISTQFNRKVIHRKKNLFWNV